MRECSIEGCGKKHRGRGYCKTHLQNIWRNGSPNTKRKSNDGRSKLPEYVIYYKIKHRCYNENNKAYKNYGGRGITVSDEWLNDFWTFYNDIGQRPTSKHQIDRVENNKGYSKDNCRWATPKENARNRRNSFTEEEVTEIRNMLGKKVFLIDIASKYNVHYSTIGKISNDTHYKGYGVNK